VHISVSFHAYYVPHLCCECNFDLLPSLPNI
jgi:hypothetical protein